MKSVDLSEHECPIPRHADRRPQTAPCSSPSTSSSPFSSIMSSPLAARLSFQTFTNFIPLSWSATTAVVPPPTLASAEHVSIAARAVRREDVNVKRGYVSKESQLAKLRSRLEHEGQGIKAHDVCRKCEDDAVFL